MSKAWFVAGTKYTQEFFAAEQLRAQQYIVYLPKLYRHPADEDFSRGQMALRFRNYLFVMFDLHAEEHGPINNTRGVDGLLASAAGEPLSMRHGVIERLRHIEDEDFARAIMRKKPEPRDDLREGDEVLIDDKDHPAYGQTGFILNLHKGLSKILIGMMPWEVRDHHLKKIEKKRKKAA